MRRIGFALFVLAGLSVVIAVVSLGFAANGPGDARTRALAYGIVNFGFAVVNAMLGLALIAGSRAG
jgi:hypothetical protein